MMDNIQKRVQTEQIQIEKQIGFKMDEVKKLEKEIVELNTLHVKNQGKLEILEELKNDGGSETE